MITLIQKQRERFDKNWNECNCNKGWDYGRCDRTSSISGQNCAHDEIKSFLTTCLIEHYEEDIRELDRIETDYGHCSSCIECPCKMKYTDGRRNFKKDAISLLQDKIKELKK